MGFLENLKFQKGHSDINWPLVSKRIFPIVYGGGIDLKSETDITKDEVKWGKN